MYIFKIRGGKKFIPWLENKQTPFILKWSKPKITKFD